MALGACDVVTEVHLPPNAQQVGFAQLAEEHVNDYWCLNYRPATESCSSIWKVSISGSRTVRRLTETYKMEIGIVTNEWVMKGRLLGLSDCYEKGGTTVVSTRIDQAARPVAQDVANATSNLAVTLYDERLETLGGYCGTYFRAGDNVWLVDVLGDDTMPEQEAMTLHFFPAAKPLRAK